MEVSDTEVEPDDQGLIQQLVSLTGLPEGWIRPELDQILEQSGQDSQKDVTLDQLRAAMLTYLESIQADLVAEKSEDFE